MKPNLPPVSERIIARVLELDRIYTQKAIAAECRISQSMVSNILVRNGLRRRKTFRAKA
jgi:predicted transcriptional regulator